MPFIRGRYHINPTMGEALEAAREAEAALLALEQQARAQRTNGDFDSDGNGEPDDGDESTEAGEPGTGPVHRVEIEAAVVVPSHSGRAARGFVARVHRSGTPANVNANATRGGLTPPETHVFADHRDLVNFLGDELAKGQ